MYHKPYPKLEHIMGQWIVSDYPSRDIAHEIGGHVEIYVSEKPAREDYNNRMATYWANENHRNVGPF